MAGLLSHISYGAYSAGTAAQHVYLRGTIRETAPAPSRQGRFANRQALQRLYPATNRVQSHRDD